MTDDERKPALWPVGRRGGSWRSGVLVAALLLPLAAPSALSEEPSAPEASEASEARRLLDAGKAAFRQKSFEEAARLFGEAYAKDGSLDAALFNQAFALRRAGDHASARGLYRRYLEKHPDDLDTLFALARTEHLLENHDEARRLYEAFIAKESRAERQRYVAEAKEQLASLPKPAPASGFQEAMSLYRQKEYDEAAALFLALYEEDEKRTKALYRHALSLRQAGRLDEARAAFERFLRGAPEDPDATYGLAETERAAGHAERAIALYESYIALEKRPSEQEYVGRAKEYVALLKAELAKRAPEPAPEPAPEEAPSPAIAGGPGDGHGPVLARSAAFRGLIEAGQAALEAGEAEAALERFTLAEARAGNEEERAVATAGLEQAVSLQRQKAGEAAKPTPTAFMAALEEGEAKLEEGDAKAALASFQRALAIDPAAARPLWGLARAHEAADDKAGARHHYRLYVESDALDKDDKRAGEAFWKAETL